MLWQTSRFQINLASPKVMGIVNVTPDSFSDGGEYVTTQAAIRHCERLVSEGAHILDVGGESTRPGSPAVSLDEELRRVLPVVQEAVRLGVAVSVDTYKPEVMRAVLDAGADVVNDVWALRREGALAAVSAHPSCGICLMHMHRDPQTMQSSPMEGDVVPVVARFLDERANALMEKGVARARVVLDPGVGFGKTVEQNFSLLARQHELMHSGFPLMAAWSRKSSLGAVTGREQPSDRVAASIAAALMAVDKGARVVRVHDVAATVDALKVWEATRLQASPNG
ncbi:MAG: dihydropteroate synthase [Hydrogenophaga sp.]|jgi:dihydropteroate synthase|nr:dihydropteroate synthase [Hydrogenophaga sp.]